MTTFQRKLWIGLIIMALLTPLGIYLPKMAGSDEAWGEWGAEAIEKMLGYVPDGMKRIADIWKAPVPDYNLGGEGASTGTQARSLLAGDSMVYVALLPGTAPGGSQATIHAVGALDSVFTSVTDGGFDPVPIVAGVGDSIEVVVTDPGLEQVAQDVERVGARGDLTFLQLPMGYACV